MSITFTFTVCQYCSFIYSFINNMTCLRYIENVYFIRKQQHIFFINIVFNKNLQSV